MPLRSKNYADKERLRVTRNQQRKRNYKLTQLYKQRKWTKEELFMIHERNITDRELSVKIGRSVQSIQCMRSKTKNY